MLKEIHSAPPEVIMTRNGHEYTAYRMLVSEIDVDDGLVFIGDREGIELFSPISIQNGKYSLYNYIWHHDKIGDITVATFLLNDHNPEGSFKEISIDQDYAPQIKNGIPVDSAAVSFKFKNKTFDICSGLGDGVYPIYGRKRIFQKINSLYVDYRIWHVRNVIFFGECELDKYSLVVDKNPNA